VSTNGTTSTQAPLLHVHAVIIGEYDDTRTHSTHATQAQAEACVLALAGNPLCQRDPIRIERVPVRGSEHLVATLIERDHLLVQVANLRAIAAGLVDRIANLVEDAGDHAAADELTPACGGYALPALSAEQVGEAWTIYKATIDADRLDRQPDPGDRAGEAILAYELAAEKLGDDDPETIRLLRVAQYAQSSLADEEL
jgi:hypothetical protein